MNKDANREAFFWVINCDVLNAEDGSGNSNLCDGITDERSAVEGGLQGYFVDGTDKQFIRYLFNETHVIKTEVQPIGYIGVEGYSCSGRDWYQQGCNVQIQPRYYVQFIFRERQDWAHFNYMVTSHRAL